MPLNAHLDKNTVSCGWYTGLEYMTEPNHEELSDAKL